MNNIKSINNNLDDMSFVSKYEVIVVGELDKLSRRMDDSIYKRFMFFNNKIKNIRVVGKGTPNFRVGMSVSELVNEFSTTGNPIIYNMVPLATTQGGVEADLLVSGLVNTSLIKILEIEDLHNLIKFRLLVLLPVKGSNSTMFSILFPNKDSLHALSSK